MMLVKQKVGIAKAKKEGKHNIRATKAATTDTKDETLGFQNLLNYLKPLNYLCAEHGCCRRLKV